MQGGDEPEGQAEEQPGGEEGAGEEQASSASARPHVVKESLQVARALAAQVHEAHVAVPVLLGSADGWPGGWRWRPPVVAQPRPGFLLIARPVVSDSRAPLSGAGPGQAPIGRGHPLHLA